MEDVELGPRCSPHGECYDSMLSVDRNLSIQRDTSLSKGKAVMTF